LGGFVDICDFSKHGIFQVMKLGMTYIDEKYLFIEAIGGWGLAKRIDSKL
jgi:hypothetical protein